MQAKIVTNRTDFVHVKIGNFGIRNADYDRVEIITKSDKTLIIKGDKIIKDVVYESGYIYEEKFSNTLESTYQKLKDRVHPTYQQQRIRTVFNWRKFKLEKILSNCLFFSNSNTIGDYVTVITPESEWLKDVTLQYSNIPYKLEILE